MATAAMSVMRKMRPPRAPEAVGLLSDHAPDALPVRLDVGDALGREHPLGHLADQLVPPLFVERAVNAGRTLRHREKYPVDRELDGRAPDVDRPVRGSSCTKPHDSARVTGLSGAPSQCNSAVVMLSTSSARAEGSRAPAGRVRSNIGIWCSLRMSIFRKPTLGE